MPEPARRRVFLIRMLFYIRDILVVTGSTVAKFCFAGLPRA